MMGSLPDVITYAKFQVVIFMGYDFTGGRISYFLIDFFAWALQQCSATALPVTRRKGFIYGSFYIYIYSFYTIFSIFILALVG